MAPANRECQLSFSLLGFVVSQAFDRNQRNFMSIETVTGLFIHEVLDAYSAENQLTWSSPKMTQAAADRQLAEAFETHLSETCKQSDCPDQVAEGCRLKKSNASSVTQWLV
jgi:ferritin-like metal-binding protein YciE